MSELSLNVKGRNSIFNFYWPNYKAVKNLLYSKVIDINNVQLLASGNFLSQIFMDTGNFGTFRIFQCSQFFRYGRRTVHILIAMS